MECNPRTVFDLLNDHAHGPACQPGLVPHRMGLIAQTFEVAVLAVDDDDARQAGRLLSLDFRRGMATWPNGSIVYLCGAHHVGDLDRLRGRSGRCFDVRIEVSQWRLGRDAITQADLGLRRGDARWVSA